MQSKNIIMAATALAVISLVLSGLSFSAVDAEEQDYDVDYGSFYSYTLQFVFDGSNAETIEWDFGDGSPVSTEWNPSHTYAEKGVYYVTQTTTNSYNGGSTTVEVYKVSVMGFPVITFDSLGGPQVKEIQQTAYGVPATKPADPVRSGYEFGGWFTSSELTEEYDWSSDVKRSMTLYAKWTQVSEEVPETFEITFEVDGGSITVPTATADSGASFVLPSYDGQKEGFEFAGWRIGDDILQPGDSVTVTGDVKATAVWKEASVTPGGDDDDGPGDNSGGDEPSGDDTSDSKDDGLFEILVLLGIVVVVIVLAAYAFHVRGNGGRR